MRTLPLRWARALEVLRPLGPLGFIPTTALAAATFAISASLSFSLIRSFADPVDPAPADVPEELSSDDSLVEDDAASEPEEPLAELIDASIDAPVELVASTPQDEPAAAPTLRVITGEVSDGSTLGAALRLRDVEPEVADRVTLALRAVLDFRSVRGGDRFALILDASGDVISFDLQRGRDATYRLTRAPDGQLFATRKEVPLERRVVQIGGVVERSLAEAIADLGEGAELTGRFADIFQWDFDFATQTQPGDEFRMMVEKFYDASGFRRYGEVLAAQYSANRREFTAVHFIGEDGRSGYYTPDGKSVRRSFLRAPVKYTRISSRYSKARLHPVLKIRRPHEGIDYAAPTGTPIWAVSEGTVIFRGWSGGFGRLLQVRHPNGYVSYYGHLSRYAAGVAKGARVRQGQVIGYVGRTGLATGPHLDYRLQYRGRFVDPLKVTFPDGDPISPEDRRRFDEQRDLLLAELNGVHPALVLEAGM